MIEATAQVTDTAQTTQAPAAKKAHFGGREHRILQLKAIAVKIDGAVEVFTNTAASDALLDAKDALAEAISFAEALPSDWKPTGSVVASKAKFEPVVGSLVQVRNKKREKFAGLMTDAEMGELVVTAIEGKKARCSAPTGVATIIPISQLRSRK